ncbi:MAG: alkaline phytoceramidase [Candidatus Rokubacteria bacterium]|nr:alkaline phytoceramidase [Candidatus Rokubacteria bacterium]
MRRGARIGVLLAVTAVAVTAACVVPPIPQDPAYHRFADTRPLASAPNGWAVLSNLPLVVLGFLGLRQVLMAPVGASAPFVESRERWPHALFFAGVALTGVGSAYYHWAPDNARLVWDRLPMTIGFMALLAAVVAERVSVTAGIALLPALLVVGSGSVVYWYAGELHGAGDLRPYALVQFAPAALIPLAVWLFPARYTHGGYLVGVIVIYGAAKLFEVLDGPIFSVGHVLSGHTLKHLTAALAAWWLLRGLDGRRPAAAEERT